MLYFQNAFSLRGTHDAIIVGIFEGHEPLVAELKQLDETLNGHLSTLVKQKQLKTEAGKITELYTFGLIETKWVLAVGLGKRSDASADTLRAGFAAVGERVKEKRMTNVTVVLPSFVSERVSEQEVARLFGESFTMGYSTIDDYKERTNLVDKSLNSVTVFHGHRPVETGIREGIAYGNGSVYAERLMSIPRTLLSPTELVTEAQALANRHGFDTETLEQKELEKLGMGGLLAASGPAENATMIVLKNKGKREEREVIGLIGAGGNGIFSPWMGGAAAVLGAMDIIGSLHSQKNVLAILPIVEQEQGQPKPMPGDVIRSYSGKTIEVDHIEAVGALLLADGITYAKELGVHSLVTVAPLAEELRSILGDKFTAAVTNDESWLKKMQEASLKSGEPIWTLPYYRPYKKRLQEESVADLRLTIGRFANCMATALFVGEFAENDPWVHLDIAGTVARARGIMARTLAAFVLNNGERELR
ncbi:M17 family peptidase N-terminal domain-containing protein [Halalkalibacterium halodurans]|uniref:Probable cytosol aminopeptidase n=1 Tax=Halalkalibacterium halodurans (strain ATCC BAA-125 / DSM 18197 / FERM 7344 / JCM 9153 / C-125) TaxID=272558 RepID=Q9K7G0_HALH5|nr:M17 family peptidase N-terminal domain-containing protein [Halalkalibacterium halodurans]MED4172705.1 M17 family peptidase N-terminal domain-containing protein [Halalkalibacterium halodurans]BAB07120.1 leucyl aminopeptidase [Halalkalibacterium halodurans C-125]